MSTNYAMLLDGGFLRHKLSTPATSVDAAGISKFAAEVQKLPCLASMRLHRIYFYDSKPLQGSETKPLGGGSVDFGASPTAARNQSLQAALCREPFFALRFGELFLEEARVAVRSESLPVAWDASWLTRLLLQRNATLNQLYRDEIVVMQERARLSASEFYEQGGHEPLRRELRLKPQTLYNFGGKLALSRSPWDAHEFPARVHDENGRISLVLLQAEIERSPGADVAAIVRASTHRNPYTGEAMAYDAETGVISFKCLHTAFHPPAPPDLCAVAVGPLGDKPAVRRYPVS
jgi:hypothetical protein